MQRATAPSSETSRSPSSAGVTRACEEANFLTRFGSQVYLIHRRDKLRASKIMQDRVIANPKIKIIYNHNVAKIEGSKEAGVQSLLLRNEETKAEERLEVDGLFVAIGHTPNSKLFQGQLKMDENGYITPHPNSTKTDIEGVYACGDVQDHVFRQAITAAGTGCMAAIEAERWLETQGH